MLVSCGGGVGGGEGDVGDGDGEVRNKGNLQRYNDSLPFFRGDVTCFIFDTFILDALAVLVCGGHCFGCLMRSQADTCRGCAASMWVI